MEAPTLAVNAAKKAPHFCGAELQQRTLQRSALLARARQTRSLRTADSAIAHTQRSRQRPSYRGREGHTDRALCLSRQARRAGRRRDREIASRRDRNASQRHALLVGKRK